MTTLFHVLNRGVDKRPIVLDNSDRLRFVHDLYVMNDRKPVAHIREKQRERTRDTLVDIHAWCLMDNHYHLLLEARDDDLKNLSRFMKKLNMGYAKYFNEKHHRSGYLWQGKYKKVEIARDAHFLHIPYYIHLNPLDFHAPKWREGVVHDTERAVRHLNAYRWSSFLDYQGKQNFASIITTKLFSHVLGNPEKQIKTIKQIISDPTIATVGNIIE